MSQAESGAGPRRAIAGRKRGPLATAALSLVVTAVDVLLLALAMGGFGAVLAHPRAIALIAVWAVTGMVLAFRRPVRSSDIVEVAAEPRFLLLGLALVPLLLPAIAAWGERQALWPLPGGEGLRWTGVAVATLGLVLRIASMAQLGPRFSPLVAMQREHALETRGLYARIRHPGYAGAGLAALGAVMAFGSALGLAPLALFGVLIAGRVRREEALMEARFGEEWRDYRVRTGALVPRILGRA